MLNLAAIQRLYKTWLPDTSILTLETSTTSQAVLDAVRENWPQVSPRSAASFSKNIAGYFSNPANPSPAYAITEQLDGALVRIVALDFERLSKPETYGFHLIAAGLPEDALGTFIAIHEAGHVALDSLLQNHACLPEDSATTDSHDELKALVAARGCANLQSRFGLEIDPTIIFPRLQESVCDLFGSAATAAELGLPQDDFIQRIADNRAILLHGVITQNIGGEEALDHHAAPLLQAAVRDFSAKKAQDGSLFSSVLDYAVKGLRTDKTLLDFPDRKMITALVSGTETPTDSALLTLAPKIKKLQALFDHQRVAMQRAAMHAVQPARGEMPQPGHAAPHRHFT